MILRVKKIKGTVSVNILKNRVYEIPLNRIYDRYKKELASMVYKVFGRKNSNRDESKYARSGITNRLLKNSKQEKPMLGSRIIFGQQIYLK